MHISADLWRDALRAREDVAKAIQPGRLGDPARPSAAVVAAVAVLAGDGDTVETGVLWGGSLLTTALLRVRYGLAGTCVGVDPLDGYYLAGPARYTRDNSQLAAPVSAAHVQAAAHRLGLAGRIELVAAASYPWPDPLTRRTFAAGFIDGDHWGDGPLRDFESLAPRTTGPIAFDNYPDGSRDGITDVRAAVERALAAHPAWGVSLVQDGVAVLERTG